MLTLYNDHPCARVVLAVLIKAADGKSYHERVDRLPIDIGEIVTVAGWFEVEAHSAVRHVHTTILDQKPGEPDGHPTCGLGPRGGDTSRESFGGNL
jgi:hypothetical protein